MADSEQHNILATIQERFQNHVHSPARTKEIRLALNKHISILADYQQADSHTKYDLPSYVQGRRRRYLEALKANRDAKAKLQSLLQKEKSQVTTPNADILSPHLAVLKLRKDHQRLGILSYYTEQANTVNIGDSVDILGMESEQNHSAKTPRYNDAELEGDISRKVHNLEVSLLNAHQDLRREQIALSALHSSDNKENSRLSSTLNALRATRAELMNWVEINLAKCDLEEGNAESSELLSNTDPSQTDEDAIDEQYTQYCLVRSKLLQIVDYFNHPLSTTQLIEDKTRKVQNPRPSESVLLAIEKQYLPLWHEKHLVKQNDTFIHDLVTNRKHQLAHELKLLSDESHLLPSYPILKKRHQKTGSTTVETRTEDRSSDTLLQAWRFANEAASVNINEHVLSMCKEGNSANDMANETLQELTQSQSTWQMLGTGNE